MKKTAQRYSMLSKHSEFKFSNKKQRFDPERIQKILKVVNTTFEKLSPINCSKNISATKSNIDTEIESIRSKVLLPDRSFPRFLSEISFTPPSNCSKLPSLNSSPSKKIKFRDLSFPKVLSRSKFNFGDSNLSPLIKIEPKRIKKLEKIKKIILQCEGVDSEIPFDSVQSEKKIKANNEYCKNVVKILNGHSFEQKIVERCISHIKEPEDNQSSLLIAKALKRGKKLWKQNHFSFIKAIDRRVNSIPFSKPFVD